MMCHCGKALHYSNPVVEEYMRRFVADLGEFIQVKVGDKTYKVQRHYIVLHGLKAKDIPSLGFEEISNA